MQRPIATEPITLARVELLHVHARECPRPAPTLLLYHGWGSSRESQVLAAEALAIDGFRVLLPDLPRHGRRDSLTHPFAPESYSHYFWPAVTQAIDEVGAFTDAAVAAGLTDPDRVATAGSSTGGMVALGALVRHPHLRTAVVMNGYPAFLDLEERARQQRGEAPLDQNGQRQLSAYDPAANIPLIVPRPVLLMHGAADAVLPPDGARRFAEQARPSYAATPDRLKLEEFPRLNHWVPTGMVSRMREWLLAHL